jgi:hypothetical protein
VIDSPSPQVVAAKAQVLAALALRATLEADPGQPRALELCAGSARWLRNVEAWALAVEPAEEEVLSAPLGALSRGERLDCQWASEELGVLAWGLDLGERPPEWEPVNASPLLRAVRFMQPDGAALRDQVHLREREELGAYLARLSVVRWASHEARLASAGRADPPALEALLRVLRARLDRAGVALREADLAAGRAEVARLGAAGLSGESPIPGLLVVRQSAAEWLAGGRRSLRADEPGEGRGDG